MMSCCAVARHQVPLHISEAVTVSLDIRRILPCVNAGSVLESVVGRYAVDWRTAPLYAGDVVVLGLNTYHMTARNLSSEARLSCDTRWCALLRLWLLGCTAILCVWLLLMCRFLFCCFKTLPTGCLTSADKTVCFACAEWLYIVAGCL